MCVNRRTAGDALGEGCADRGEALYRELKGLVARRGLVSRVWVTRTLCLGVCPREGATVARTPPYELLSEVALSDAPRLLP